MWTSLQHTSSFSSYKIKPLAKFWAELIIIKEAHGINLMMSVLMTQNAYDAGILWMRLTCDSLHLEAWCSRISLSWYEQTWPLSVTTSHGEFTVLYCLCVHILLAIVYTRLFIYLGILEDFQLPPASWSQSPTQVPSLSNPTPILRYQTEFPLILLLESSACSAPNMTRQPYFLLDQLLIV